MLITNTQNSPFGAPGDFSAMTQYGADKFPNPFMDIASEYLPSDMNQIFELCEYIYLTYGTYRSAARRVVRYFLTELVLSDIEEKEREDIEDFLLKKLHIMSVLAEIGDDFSCYGNCFISVSFPFDRFLVCPKCQANYHIDTIKYKFDLKDLSFTAECKGCGYKGKFQVDDRKSFNKDRVEVLRWSPKDMRLRIHPFTNHTEYFMNLDPKFVQKIKDGNPFYLNTTPWEVLECIKETKSGESPLFKFDRQSIYHLHESTLAGLPVKGWGIPPIIPNFKLAYYIQILRRYDEAIAFDFIVPHRILFPDTSGSVGAGGMDALQTTSMGVFNSFLQNMIKTHRKDPTAMQAAPFKVGYTMIGGEGNQLAPKDSIAFAMDELLNAVGFPADLYKGNLQLQVAPVALRLFEKTWSSYVEGINDIANWLVSRIAHHFKWGAIKAELRSVTLADDIERKALTLQAAAGMDISKGTAYSPFGIDYMNEQKKVLDEQQKIQELQQEAMADQQAMGMQMGQEEGPQAQGGVGATPGDIHAQGKEMAYQLVTQVPDSLRRGELIKIKHTNPTLHAIVTQEMDNLRQEFSRQGQAAMIQAAGQQGGQAKMASANTPSPFKLGLDIVSAVGDYNREDLRKIAMDIKHGVKGADKAFSFVYSHLKGLI